MGKDRKEREWTQLLVDSPAKCINMNKDQRKNHWEDSTKMAVWEGTLKSSPKDHKRINIYNSTKDFLHNAQHN